MKFLLDTNVLIKLEPSDRLRIDGAESAVRLVRLLNAGEGHGAYVHPAIENDIARDPDTARQNLNRFLFGKYAALPHPPRSDAVARTLGTPTFGTNDWVDLQLIAALDANAIDYVVTEDGALLRKLHRLGLGDRGLTVLRAVDLLSPCSIACHRHGPPCTRHGCTPCVAMIRSGILCEKSMRISMNGDFGRRRTGALRGISSLATCMTPL